MSIMRPAILAGGPHHGKRLDDVEPREITIAVMPPTPLVAVPKQRPKFLSDPLGWWRWKQGVSIEPIERLPAPQQHLYRATGYLDDGTRVYWWQGEYAGEPPFDGADVLRRMWTVASEYERDHPFAATDPFGGDTRWEMGPDWYAALRRAAIGLPGNPQPGDTIFARPVRVTTGSPRIVTEDTPS